ncbi:outer membrane protein [Methylovirgula sp. 4M-Z18]|uniref:outer membrane protein n=1 Tax=Methylovirgula sp. 4M-Z18 TaxID=2293567 RepID=UPI000E2F8695|nr:outer membrane protein [Methylovirgula sp. 4M-Z18]RFB79316.1 porin family protein [Methylovirgula sp. 4M-Z18]
MKKILILGVTASALCAASALAADLPSKKPPVVYVPPAPVFTWAGPYVGIYAGAGFGQDKLTGNTAAIGSHKTNSTGFTGGGLAGYNFQFGQIVVGPEADFGYDGNNKSSKFNNRTVKHEQSWVGRVRGRIGYAITPDILLYGAGGVSFADNKVTLTTPAFHGNKSKDLVGWNAGAGAEYAITRNILGRVEYIYDDYGKETYDFGATRRIKSTYKEHTVRAALEYKF